MDVLIVDDSKSLRLLVGVTLRHAGHAVVEAGDGAEALDVVAARPIGCVVCDLNMPRMDGFTFLDRLRALPGHGKTPVVMLTTECSPDSVARGRKAGVRAWIVKPFRAEQLVEAVAAAAAL